MPLPRTQGDLCDREDGGSIVNPLDCGVVMCTGHGSGNTGETQWLQKKQGRDDTDQGFQNIKDIVASLRVEKLSSSQVVTVHWSGCTAAGIYKFLSHAWALFHCSHSHVIYSCKAPQSCWTLGDTSVKSFRSA